MTAYYLSFGCKVNQYETNALRGMLSREAFSRWSSRRMRI